MSEWKTTRNDLSKLTLEQFIQNTIDEETNKAFEETIEENNFNYIEEGYYRAVAILNEVLV